MILIFHCRMSYTSFVVLYRRQGCPWLPWQCGPCWGSHFFQLVRVTKVMPCGMLPMFCASLCRRSTVPCPQYCMWEWARSSTRKVQTSKVWGCRLLLWVGGKHAIRHWLNPPVRRRGIPLWLVVVHAEMLAGLPPYLLLTPLMPTCEKLNVMLVPACHCYAHRQVHCYCHVLAALRAPRQLRGA